MANCNNEGLEIEKILDELSKERDVFNSEADFQFSLAWKIKEYYEEKYKEKYQNNYKEEFKKNFKVKLEYTIIVKDKRKRVDIMVIKDGVKFPIELKYKTKISKDNINVKSEKDSDLYNLTNQGAKDITSYDYFKDIQEIELIQQEDSNIGKGYVIMLTNDSNYKDGKGENTFYENFSIYNTRKIEQGSTLCWKKEKTTKKRISKEYI